MNAWKFGVLFPSKIKEIRKKAEAKGLDPSEIFKVFDEGTYYRIFYIEDPYLFEDSFEEEGWTEIRIEKG